MFYSCFCLTFCVPIFQSQILYCSLNLIFRCSFTPINYHFLLKEVFPKSFLKSFDLLQCPLYLLLMCISGHYHLSLFLGCWSTSLLCVACIIISARVLKRNRNNRVLFVVCVGGSSVRLVGKILRWNYRI